MLDCAAQAKLLDILVIVLVICVFHSVCCSIARLTVVRGEIGQAEINKFFEHLKLRFAELEWRTFVSLPFKYFVIDVV